MLGLRTYAHEWRPCGAAGLPCSSLILHREGVRRSDLASRVDLFRSLPETRRRPPACPRVGKTADASRLETAEDGAYTPFTLMRYSKSPDRICHCEAKIVAQAPIEECFKLWNDWTSLLNFLDLIGELHLGGMPDNMAVLLCYYRWGDTPTLEIMMKMSKEEIVPNKHIKFKSLEGMPMKGIVEFTEVKGGTEVSLRFENCLPQPYVDFNIGHIAVMNNVDDILKENMEQFKLLAEGKQKPQENLAVTDEQRKAILAMCRTVMEKPLPDIGQ